MHPLKIFVSSRYFGMERRNKYSKLCCLFCLFVACACEGRERWEKKKGDGSDVQLLAKRKTTRTEREIEIEKNGTSPRQAVVDRVKRGPRVPGEHSNLNHGRAHSPTITVTQ